MNTHSVRKAGMLLFILLFPAVLYVVFSTAKHSFFNRPIYGPKSIDANSDTIYYQISGADFIDCRGQRLSFESLRGNITVLSFFSGSNSALDSRINGQLLSLQDRYRGRKDVKILSVLSSSKDTAALCELESSFNVENEIWKVVRPINISQPSLESILLMDDQQSNYSESTAVLIDKKGRIRGFRDASQYVEMKELIDDIKVLKAEEFIPRKQKK